MRSCFGRRRETTKERISMKSLAKFAPKKTGGGDRITEENRGDVLRNLHRRKLVVVTESPKKTEGEQRAREKWLTWDSVAASFLRGLWFGTHLGNLIPERNYRFEAMLGEVESSNCRSRAAKNRQIRGTESPPAAKTPTNRACFPDDARSTRPTHSNETWL